MVESHHQRRSRRTYKQIGTSAFYARKTLQRSFGAQLNLHVIKKELHGYATMADLLQGFCDRGCLPKSLDLSRLDDGKGIEATLKQHKGKWHDSCRLQYNRTQLQRAAKRTRPSDDECTTSGSKKRFTRKSIEQPFCPLIETCFFCNKPSSC